MAPTTISSSSSSIITKFVIVLLLIISTLNPILSLQTNQTLQPQNELRKLRKIRSFLRKINKPAVKSIQSPEGDVIDCVASHLQPAFDHPKLKGQKPLDPPVMPKGSELEKEEIENINMLWTQSGESCPNGTIPIRRTTEDDFVRGSKYGRFGRKPIRRRKRITRRDTSDTDHEHAVASVNGNQYYGAKASMNVWTPKVTNELEFSLSQIWVISGSFGNDLNTIEAGWQVNPALYGDQYPRLFTYWTTDAYQATGCYNLLCSGFVQINSKIAIGAAISPRSSLNGNQYDISITVWKDPKHGHWWLKLGSGSIIGYWPSFLFSHLRSHANMIQFGGEVVNTRSQGFHTATQMGSGHFADEGFRKAAYFRNLQVVDWDNNLISLSNLHLLADHSNCYNIKQGRNNAWGAYFYYGGPGRNVRCP